MKKIKTIFLTIILATLGIQGSYAATYSFNPPAENFYEGCVNTVVIDIDTEGIDVNGGDIEVSWDPDEIEIIDNDPNVSGTQIGTGTAFHPLYIGNIVDVGDEEIRLSGATFPPYLNGKKDFAFIQFRSKPGTTSTEFTFNHTPGLTTDSNIGEASTSAEILSGVTNGSYTFSAPPFGSCENDVQAPQVIFVNPTSGQTGVPANSTITIQITDDISGIDLNSLSFFLNGEEYVVADSEVTYTGTPNDYTFVITPRANNQIIEGEGNSLIASGQDTAGNTFNRQIVFNVPGQPTQPPGPTTPPVPTATPMICPICDTCDTCDDLSFTICHNPGDNEQTMVVTSTSLNGHIDHGDYMGGCTDDPICTIQTTEDVFITDEELIQEVENMFQCVQDSLKRTPILEQFPVVKQIAESIDSNLTAAALVTGAAGLNLLSFLSLLNTPSLFVSLIGFLIGKRHRKPWGVVLDASTNKPIQFSICKLYEGGTMKVIDQTISDSEGRYGFPIVPGSYRLEVSKNSYEKHILKLNIQEGEVGYVNDVELIPSNLKARLVGQKQIISTILKTLGTFYRRIFPIIFLLGFAISVISVYTNPVFINILIFVLYLITSTIFFYTKFDVKAKYSTIIDSKTTLRLPNALIKIFDSKTGELIDTKLTNDNGYFDFWGDPGEYNILVSVKGYNFPSEIQTDLMKTIVRDKQMLKLNLKKGHNKYRVLVDPV